MLSFVYFIFFRPDGLWYCTYAIIGTFIAAITIPPFGLINTKEFEREPVVYKPDIVRTDEKETKKD